MRKLLYSPWQTLKVPFAITSIGQLHQSPPSPVPGDRARGKQRAPDPPSQPLPISNPLFFSISLILSEIGRLPRVFFAKSEIRHSSLSDLNFFGFFAVLRPERGCRGSTDPRTATGILVRFQRKKISCLISQKL